MTRPSVAVVVIGDLGRSPRMQYHCLSLANQANYDVDFIGFSGSPPCEELSSNEHIRIHQLEAPEIPRFLNHFYVSRVFYKCVAQLLVLFQILLFTIKKPEFILCQNPPAIPLLAVALLVCKIRGSKLVIDWHNYGFTWLAVNRPGSFLLVFLHKIYEKLLGRFADYHFCVSHAMKNDLKMNWKIDAFVLHDRPQPFFHKSKTQEKISLFSRNSFLPINPIESNPVNKQISSKSKNDQLLAKPNQKSNKNINSIFKENEFIDIDGNLKEDRPALVVSSTSWTADEDFSLLLDSVLECDQMAIKNEPKHFPKVRLVVTGQGDLKSHYEARISKMKLKYFSIATTFLSFADYACLLGSADFGISLHFSSSKLDLPMKVVDMFGSGCPVLAFDYGCLNELVQNQKTGFTFTTRQQLSNIMFELLKTFPHDTNRLQQMSLKIQEEMKKANWNQTWKNAALPIFAQQQSIKSKQNNHLQYKVNQGDKMQSPQSRKSRKAKSNI